MTLAELFLLVAGGAGIYFLLRPVQRWLELQLRRRLAPLRRPHAHPPAIDVVDFTSEHHSRRKDEPRP